MRYKILEDMVASKETENLKMRKELQSCLELCNAAKDGEKLPKKAEKQFKEDLEVSDDTDASEKND